MSKLGTFIRACPSCGRRFHVKLVSEAILSDKVIEEPVSQEEVIRIGTGSSVRATGRGYTPITTREEGTLTTDMKEFEDSYKCGLCGHQWSERREEESKRTH